MAYIQRVAKLDFVAKSILYCIHERTRWHFSFKWVLHNCSFTSNIVLISLTAKTYSVEVLCLDIFVKPRLADDVTTVQCTIIVV